MAVCIVVRELRNNMSKKDKSLALLPNGFVDLLPSEAQREADCIRILTDCFRAYGYMRVKPPLLEFEDSLLAPGPGARLASETFRVMDPLSHRMLGVRSDITPQIARIVSSRLDNVSRPLRLTYANDVLRTKGDQARTERQFTQVGCEMIGDSSGVDGDVEVCVLAVLGLKALGIEDITLDFTIPGFVADVLQGVDADILDEVLVAVSRRDVDTLTSYKLQQTDVLADVIGASGCADRALDVSADYDFAHLAAVYRGVQKAINDLDVQGVALTIDVVEQDGFEYHQSFGFTLFSKAAKGELGRGGCYSVCFGDETGAGEVAKGFTLYMDTISKCVSLNGSEKRVFVPVDVSWADVVQLQSDGWITVRGDAGHVPDECTHIYDNGQVNEIS